MTTAPRTDTRRAALVAGALALFAFVPLLWLYEDRVGTLPGEQRLAAHLFERPTNVLVQNVTDFVIRLGDPGVVLVTLAIAVVVVWRAMGPRAALLIPLAALAAAGARIAKAILGPTPFYEQVQRFAPTPPTGNLPSGHTSYVVAVFGLLALYALWRGRRELAVVLALTIPAMGLSLVLAGSHLPSDILGGLAFGAAWAMLLLAAVPIRR